MENNATRVNKTRYYCLYTTMFLFVCSVAFSYFYLNGLSFVNFVNDGLRQHYKALIYYSDYLKGIASSFFGTGKLTIPQWDFSIGEGADIIQTMHYYVLGDPFALLSVFFSKENMYICYDLTIILRLYTAGLVFSSFCFYFKQEDKYAVLAGTLTYIFSYWALLNVCEHIYFLNPLINLPLVIMGIEKIIRNEKPYLLTISVFISAISNFYFFYIIVILTVIYTVVRFLTVFKLDFKKMALPAFKIVLYSLLGTLMAAVILLPVVIAMLSDKRISADNGVSLLYPMFYYERLIAIAMSNDYAYDLCMGFASPCILAVLLTYKDIKENTSLCVLNTIGFAMMIFPVFGKILNGFAYAINRWSFALSLLASFSLTVEWNNFKKNKMTSVILSFMIFGVSIVSAWSRQEKVLIPVCILLFFLLLQNFESLEKKRNSIIQIAMIGLIVLNILYVADSDYSYRGSLRTKKAASIEMLTKETIESDAEQYKKYNTDTEFVRYAGNNLSTNSAVVSKTNTTGLYWSLTNHDVIDFRRAVGINDYMSHWYDGYDGRTALNTLANVKYYVNKEDDTVLPYNYSLESMENGYSFSVNNDSLPFGYTYSNVMSLDEWNTLKMVEKQEALLDRVILEGDFDHVSFSLDPEILNFKLDEGISKEGNVIDVSDGGLGLTIEFNGKENSEYYLCVSGLDFNDIYNTIEDNHTQLMINVECNGVSKNIHYYTKDFQFYSDCHDFSICLGVCEEKCNEISMKFMNKGEYVFENIEVYCIDTSSYSSKMHELADTHLINVDFDINRITGSIETPETKYLLLSIPYSEGWSAKVDGNDAILLNANKQYTALKLDKGYHNIELNYSTPYLKTGLAISCLSLISFCYLYYRNRK